ncbi:hypothetical protein DFP72DRAFT_907209 [Ephemerocybe angulata]|uniref:Uncharacterized protein n=1 Tax=Ephemerocybe angulata TaxID=980116 RepID=A0A8H6HS81_9AGAR|nr:hypothetical protein DFP72DRAFT_907181 [Tulosesus angulatus]KAF6751482.1 hypothetical protein DFP72DRAFT_907209 [Tulosesus angulatus]
MSSARPCTWNPRRPGTLTAVRWAKTPSGCDHPHPRPKTSSTAHAHHPEPPIPTQDLALAPHIDKGRTSRSSAGSTSTNAAIREGSHSQVFQTYLPFTARILHGFVTRPMFFEPTTTARVQQRANVISRRNTRPLTSPLEIDRRRRWITSELASQRRWPRRKPTSSSCSTADRGNGGRPRPRSRRW